MTVFSTRWRTRVYITVNSVTGPQVSIVKTVSDLQLKPLENGHKLRKAPRAIRNFSCTKSVFYCPKLFAQLKPATIYKRFRHE
jgi:hypothetical protein